LLFLVNINYHFFSGEGGEKTFLFRASPVEREIPVRARQVIMRESGSLRWFRGKPGTPDCTKTIA
jgi:hypothetical protein